MRNFWGIALLVGVLALSGCNGDEAGESGAGAADDATVAAPADTPVVEETPTVEVAPSADMTGTEMMTETTDMSSTEMMTGSTDMSNTESVTGTDMMTDTTGAMSESLGGSLMMGDNSEYGQILTDGEGRTVYMFAKDTPDTSNCTGDCLTKWPPVPAGAEQAVAGEGLDNALLGTITRDDGTSQLTYNGYPLYYYADDTAAGDTNGQGVGGNWYVLDASGTPVQN